MLLFIALLVIIDLVVAGVALAPMVKDKWNNASASEFTTNVAQPLPNALAWPARAYRRMTERG
jgi:hypothetical protein